MNIVLQITRFSPSANSNILELSAFLEPYQHHYYFPEWGVYTVRTFNEQSPKTIFITNTLSLTILSTHFSATDIPTPSVLTLLPIQYSLYLFAYSAKEPAPTTSTSCLLNAWHINLNLSANVSTNSPTLLVSETTFLCCDHDKHNALPQQSIVLRSGWVSPPPVLRRHVGAPMG